MLHLAHQELPGETKSSSNLVGWLPGMPLVHGHVAGQ